MRACWARHDPRWNCRLWLAHTPRPASLPQTASDGRPRSSRSRPGRRRTHTGGVASEASVPEMRHRRTNTGGAGSETRRRWTNTGGVGLEASTPETRRQRTNAGAGGVADAAFMPETRTGGAGPWRPAILLPEPGQTEFRLGGTHAFRPATIAGTLAPQPFHPPMTAVPGRARICWDHNVRAAVRSRPRCAHVDRPAGRSWSGSIPSPGEVPGRDAQMGGSDRPCGLRPAPPDFFR